MNVDWGDGAYEETGRQLVAAAEVAVTAAAITAGERVLDVGCGTGNAALIAARCGAEVTGIDPASRLVEVARRRAAEANLAATFAAGDAASPGVPDASFDAALGVFSIIFAPDPGAAVAGAVRAVRPGGRVVVTTWIPEGPIHESSMVFGKAMLEGAEPPPSPWMNPTSIRELFADCGADVSIAEHTLAFEAKSADAWLDDLEADHPFWRAARAHFADRPDHYAGLRERALAILRDGSERADRFLSTSRYRVVRADLPGSN